MKVWKSPVFYLGILLVVAIVALMAAPYVIDWNSYRADLESYGRKLTGREVRIDGPISARLFPFPRLVAEDVHVANLPGLAEKEFASAARIDVQIALAGLLSGSIQVESINIDQPVVAFERSEGGTENWRFSPSADIAADDLLGRVKLDHIALNDGVVRLVDQRLDTILQLDGVNASLSAPDARGPWRLRSRAKFEGRDLDIALNTGSWKPDEVFRLGLRVADPGGSGLAYSFDGETADNGLKGQVRVEPVAADGQSAAAAALMLSANVTATFENIAFDGIQIGPTKTDDGTASVASLTGSASVTLGAAMSATADLEAPSLDLDQMAGGDARGAIQNGVPFHLAAALLRALPQGVTFDSHLKVASLRAGGENLDNVEVELAGNTDMLKLDRLHASGIGRSEMLLTGSYVPGGEGGEFTGTLSLNSGDLRQLTGWLWPAGKAQLAGVWAGERGRVKLESEVSFKPSRLRFANTRYELDGIAGSGDLVVGLGEHKSIDLRVDTDLLDVDRYVLPRNPAAFPALLAALVPAEDAADLRLTLQSKQLQLNGMEAEDIALDLAANATGLELRTVQIGSAGGARLDASGLILRNSQGQDSSIGVEVKAEDPRGLLRLAGLMPVDRETVWSGALGPTRMTGTLTFKQAEAGPSINLDLSGTSGALTFTASANGDPAQGLAAMPFSGSVEIKAPNGEELGRLAGFIPIGSDQSPALFKMTGRGTATGNFDGDLHVEAFGSTLDYQGRLGPGISVDGKASVMSTNALGLFAALGMPAGVTPSGILVLQGDVKNDGEAAIATTLNGHLGDTPLNISASLSEGLTLKGNVETGDVAVSDLLAAGLLEWNGRAPALDTPFAASLPFGLTGEIWIAPKSLTIGDVFSATGVQAVISASAEEMRVNMFGKDAAGRSATIDITSTRDGEEGLRKVSGKINLPIDLSRQLLLASGGPAAEGQGKIEVGFAGSGRSAGGTLAALSGSGSYDIHDLTVLHVDPAAFKAAAAQAGDGSQLIQAFAALSAGDALPFGTVSGTVNIVNGVASLLPFSMKSPDAEATVTTLAELGTGGLDISLALKIIDTVERPHMDISFAGPPTALTRSEDKAALFGKMGVDMMDKGVAELERLRQEQERLAAEEEKARQEDETRLQDYYAQRDELRLHQRELKVHAALRALAAEQLRQEIEQSRAANLEINKAELKDRLRMLKVHRRLQRLAEAGPEPQVQAKPKPKPQPVPVPQQLPEQQTIILPPSQQDASPSQ